MESEILKKRNYGIDVLKIICMFMVLTIHITGPILNVLYGKTAYWAVFFIKTCCLCAVNCYALISGYVGVNSKHKMASLAYLWCTVLFYSVIISTIALAFGKIGVFDFAKSFFPILSIQYWYFSSYFILFLLMPVANVFVNKSGIKEQISVLFVLISMSFGGSILNALNDLWSMNEGYSAFWLFTMYYLGAFLKKNNLLVENKGLFVYIASVLVTWISEIIFWGKERFEGLLVSYISPTIIISAVALLAYFSRIKINEKMLKFVKFVTPLSFSVYIIHYNKNIWPFLVDVIFNICKYNIVVVILLIFILLVTIYSGCVAIDLLRFKLFEKIKLNEFCVFCEKKLDASLSNKHDKRE